MKTITPLRRLFVALATFFSCGNVHNALADGTVADGMDQPSRTFYQFSGYPQFSCVSGITHDGVDAVRSPTLGDLGYSQFFTDVTGPLKVAYWMNVSTAVTANPRDVGAYGPGTDNLAGVTGWVRREVNVIAGDHTLGWGFYKQGNGIPVVGFDGIVVDELTLSPPTAVPVITTPLAFTGTVPITQYYYIPASQAYASISVTGLPPGLSHDVAEGYIWGRPLVSGVFNATAMVTNSFGSDTKPMTFTITNPSDALRPFVDNAAVNLVGSEAFTSPYPEWTGQTSVTHDGVDAIRSGVITHNQASDISVYVQGPALVSWWWKTDCEATNDKLIVTAENNYNTPVHTLSGPNTAWEKRSMSLTGPEARFVRFRYVKNGSVSVGADAGYIDEIVIAPDFAEIEVDQTFVTALNDGQDTVSFGSVSSGNSGAAQSFTIRNRGTIPLSITGINTVGGNSGDFTVSGPAMPLNVATGGSTTFTVTFTPPAQGARTTALEIVSNDTDESPFDVTFTGTGTPPAPEIAVEHPVGTDIPHFGSVSFGSVTQGTSSTAKTFTIKNTGLAALNVTSMAVSSGNNADFVLSTPATPFSVAPVASVTFTASFSPTGLGARSAYIVINNNDTNEAPFYIQVKGTGLELVDSAPVITSTLTGTTFVPFFFSYQITATDAATSFAATGLPTGLSVNTATGLISGVPSVTGVFNVQLSAANAAFGAGPPSTLVLTITNPNLPYLDALDLPPTTPMGLENTWTVQTAVTHDGVDALTTSPPGVFTWSRMSFPIEGPATFSCWWKAHSGHAANSAWIRLDGFFGTVQATITEEDSPWRYVEFAVPAGVHYVEITMDRFSSDPGHASTMWLDQVSITYPAAPEIAVEQPAGTDLLDGTASIGCGTVNTGSSVVKTFTIKNTGTAALTVTGASVTGGNFGDFIVNTTGMASSVAAAGSTTFTVAFTPTAVGVRTTTLQIMSNDDDEATFDITLTGTGNVPVDGDADGMPDAWEITHFGSAGAVNGTDDADGDGLNNFGEYALGLDPNKGDLSGLPQPVVTNGKVTLSIAKQPFVSYSVVANDTLGSGSFTTAGLTVVTDTATTLTVTETSTAVRRYFKILAVPMP
jgi:Abnormal spindle-like microcephaly-assoc'd, ASPM-SPD-2-Hydin